MSTTVHYSLQRFLNKKVTTANGKAVEILGYRVGDDDRITAIVVDAEGRISDENLFKLTLEMGVALSDLMVFSSGTPWHSAGFARGPRHEGNTKEHLGRSHASRGEIEGLQYDWFGHDVRGTRCL